MRKKIYVFLEYGKMIFFSFIFMIDLTMSIISKLYHKYEMDKHHS